MKRGLGICAIVACALSIATLAMGASFEKEIRNALKRGKEGFTFFHLHLPNGETIVVTGSDYDNHVVHVDNLGLPVSVELFSGSGSKKHNIFINIRRATYYKLDIEKDSGEWHYEFHFYF